VNDVVVITGIRELAVASHDLVRERVQRACGDTTLMIFGGAIGVDTVALHAAGTFKPAGGSRPQLVAIVPFTRRDQPMEARVTLDHFAHVIRELGLPQGREAYLQRNDVMLERAEAVNHARKDDQHSLLLAFTDGRTTGGTAYTIREAKKLGIRTEVVTVKSEKRRS